MEELVSAPKSRLSFDGPKGPLFQALAEARKHYKPLTTSATAKVRMKAGGEYTFEYAPLDVVIDAVTPGLVAAGVVLSQPHDGEVLYTIVAHGESSMTVETPLPRWDTPQELGSLLTYMRRYAIKGVFGVADCEDDDGGSASKKVESTKVERRDQKKPPSGPDLSEALMKSIVAAGKDNELSREEFYAACKKATGIDWANLTEEAGEKFLASLQPAKGAA